MKGIILSIAFAASVVSCFSQESISLCHIDKDLDITSLGHRSSETQKFDCGFTNNERAYREIQKIMNLAGLPMEFTVCKSDNIKNAYASMDSAGVRFIVYDEKFLKQFDSDSSRLETVTALAHEIGHHLSGHTIALSDQEYHDSSLKYCKVESKTFDKVKCDRIKTNYLKECREQELEADRFAGFIMYRYGASLPQITSLYYKMTSNYNDSLSDHPNLDKRLAAIKAGYELAGLYKGANITYVDLEKIKGRKIEFDITDLSVIKRNMLVEKINNCIQQAASFVTESKSGQALSLGSGGQFINQEQIIKYIGNRDNFWLVDRPTEYFALNNYFITLSYDQRVRFIPEAAIHIKDGILMILVFGVQEKPKIVYQSPFKEDKISFEEIKVIFVEIFREGIGKEIAKYYPS